MVFFSFWCLSYMTQVETFVSVRKEMNLRENIVRQRDSCDIELSNSFIFSQNKHQIVLKSSLEMVLNLQKRFRRFFSNLLLLIQCPFLYIFGNERSCLTDFKSFPSIPNRRKPKDLIQIYNTILSTTNHVTHFAHWYVQTTFPKRLWARPSEQWNHKWK